MDNQNAMGLGSLRQHGVAIPSETKNIEYFFNLAKKMSDGQLADILSGKSLDVPQFVAMTEAMGRKELRQAAEGAQAQQALKEPSIKDRLVAEDAARRMPMQMAGIDQLPANNMRTLAGGGIIAFEDGGEVEHYADTGVVGNSAVKDAWDALKGFDPGETTKGEGWGSDISNFFSRTFDSDRKIDPDTGKPITFKEFLNKQERKVASTRAPSVEETKAFTATPAATAPVNPTKSNAPAANPAAPGSQVDVTQPTTFERRANPFAQIRADAVDEVGIKDRGLGFGLMKLASHVVSTPGTKGFGEGINALADQGLLTQKELKDAKKDARDYNFNIMKASEAAEQGNDELALKYKTLAEQTDYHKTMGKAAMITAQAHATTAAAAGEKPDMQLLKMAYDHVDKQMKESIKFKNYFESLSPEDKAQYIQALALQNKQIYTGIQSPGKSGATAKFLGFET